ncbi:MAG: hypothetical protein ACRD4Q_07450 [Candidatus Acidiferrales bacterium]
MTILSTIETDIGKVLHWLTNASGELSKVAPEVQAAILAAFQAVVTAVIDTSGAVAAGGLNFSLDAAVVADIKQVIATGKADLEKLGLKV